MDKHEINNILWHEMIKIINPDFEKNSNFKIEQVAFDNYLKVERLTTTAKIPKKAYSQDAGYDLFSDDYYTLFPNDRVIIKTGVKISIPDGYAGLVWDKGGVAKEGIHTIAGVIDAGYRGEILINLINLSGEIYNISSGQKIAQLLIQKVANFKIIEEEIDIKTDRGEGRYGSSGMF